MMIRSPSKMYLTQVLRVLSPISGYSEMERVPMRRILPMSILVQALIMRV